MNIILVSGKNYFVDAMIDKLNKEGHKTFCSYW